VELEPKEGKKIALGNRRESAISHSILFHAIPLAGALALIILNILGRFWGNPPWIAVLQFVAKAHEILMQASIGIVMLAYMQFLLCSGKAPFGALFSYYNISQLAYLFSPEFSAVLTTPNFRGPLKIGFILFVPFSILLATTVGPATAIALQPRHINFTIPLNTVVFNATTDQMFPTAFSNPGPPLLVSQNDSYSAGDYPLSLLNVLSKR
jgi:hypothetical protein